MVVALEGFLATEVARADSADEGFRGILSQGLLVALEPYHQALIPL